MKNRLFVAITTPFDDNDFVNYGAFLRHIRFLESSGVKALFIAGTTGEFSALTREEKRELLKVANRAFSGELVYNISSTSLKETLVLLEDAEKFGASAITLLPPYYLANAPKEGIVNFYKEVTKRTKLPLIIYNFSRHSQNSFTKEMLSEIEHFAIKDSDKDLSMIENSNLYFGAGDSIIVDSINAGAGGIVSVQGNYRPKEVLALFNSAMNKDNNLDDKQSDLADVSAVFRESNQIARIKEAVSQLVVDYPTNVRLPLMGLSEKEKSIIKSTVDSFDGRAVWN